MDSDRGTMYSTAATFAAIWCAAEATVPWRAMNSAISVNDVTSTITASPAGTPRRAKPEMVGQCGGSMRRQRPNGA